ncbi:MAG: hypothetical protein PHI42_01935 [Paludibacteraceae bacterium]|nr:hypothetical protein [Paludibacteraceae bacterium]
MNGLEILKSLPATMKGQIAQQYGSIEKFYQLVFSLHATNYNLFMNKPAGYQLNQQQIQIQIEQIEYKLESFGLEDGSDITNEIASDHEEIIVNREIQKLDNDLRKKGSDYDSLRKWLNDKYGI